MIVHFQNPIILILSKAILGNSLSVANFVIMDPNGRGLKRNKASYIEESHRWQYSQQIAKALDINLKKITWECFKQSNKLIIDSNLIGFDTKFNGEIVLHSSDTYCVFGFKSYSTFMVHKLRLFWYWRSRLKIKNKKKVYIYNKKIQSNNRIVNIDTNKVRDLAFQISKTFSNPLSESMQHKNNILLILPPRIDVYGLHYHQKFFKYIRAFSSSESTEVILKPHRGDLFRYQSEWMSRNDLPKFQIIDKNFPAELLLADERVTKIISTPSSSLAFADTSKLTVLVPKDRYLFKLHDLDQMVFLQNLGVDFKKI